jgi:hypothetical protein
MALAKTTPRSVILGWSVQGDLPRSGDTQPDSSAVPLPQDGRSPWCDDTKIVLAQAGFDIDRPQPDRDASLNPVDLSSPSASDTTDRPILTLGHPAGGLSLRVTTSGPSTRTTTNRSYPYQVSQRV